MKHHRQSTQASKGGVAAVDQHMVDASHAQVGRQGIGWPELVHCHSVCRADVAGHREESSKQEGAFKEKIGKVEVKEGDEKRLV